MNKKGLSMVMVGILLLLAACTPTTPLVTPLGIPGPQGAQGAPGIGVQGLQGLRGPQGQQGPQGPEGSQGPQGLQGLSGNTSTVAGPQGPEGPRGYTGGGATGATGVQGAAGAAGAAGAQGAQGAQGLKGDTGMGAPTVRLVPKDPTTWAVINGSKGGILEYTERGKYFGYYFSGFGLNPTTSYSLIYYADFADRATNWGGNNPGALIAVGTSDSTGRLYLIGRMALNINLPAAPDANISQYSYNTTPDYYANAHGAKIWLVPSSMYSSADKKVTVWSPNDFLFETDLINYTYTP